MPEATFILNEDDGMATVSPNPAVGHAVFAFKSALSSPKATVELYDVAGNLVEVLFNNKIEHGMEYRISLDVSRVPNGVYFIKFNNGMEVETEKLIIQD
jgi:hypothetical protein